MNTKLLDVVISAIERQEGFRPGTRAWNNNNPGNLKMGRFARMWGAIGQDDEGHAIFESKVQGREALRALLRTKFRGQTLRQIGAVYAEDPHWAEGVSKIADVGMDVPIGVEDAPTNNP